MPAQAIHILLVEDEEAHAELICRACEAPATRITVAGSLQEARAAMQQSAPDLAIIDSLLPDGEGAELLPGKDVAPRYPIILMTSQGDDRRAAEAREAGAWRYVVKTDETLIDMPRIAEQALSDWHRDHG